MSFVSHTLLFLAGVLLSRAWGGMPWMVKALVVVNLSLLLAYLTAAGVIYVKTSPGSWWR